MMVPITRASVNCFCRVCLQHLDILQNTGNFQHNLKENPQLLRIIELMADGVKLTKPIINLAMPTCLCYSCYIKVIMFRKFAEMSFCARVALNELTAEQFDLKEDIKFNICCTCFKIKSNHKQSLNTSSAEVQSLLRLILIGIYQNKLNDENQQANNICQQCSQKLKTFLNFRRTLLESHKYIVSTVMSNTDNIPKLGAFNFVSSNTNLVVPTNEANKNEMACIKYDNEETSGDDDTDFTINNTILNPTKAEKKCPYCQREFKRKTHLKDHVKLVHEGLRPYKCEFCERAFGLPRTLRIHIMGHTKERPFKCKICQKAFRQNTELNLHLNNHFASSQFRCPICSHDRASQEDLDVHLARHNNKEGYQCSTCGRKFKKLCHNNCGKAFGARKTLLTHQRIHTGERPYNCDICRKQLSCKASLLRHSRTHKDTVVKQEIVE